MNQLPNIHADTFVDSTSVDQRKQVIKILEANERELIGMRSSYNLAAGILIYPKDRALQAVVENTFSRPVLSAEAFIQANEI